MASEANAIIDFDPKDMPFRRLGSSGLRVPVFSLGGCACRVVQGLGDAHSISQGSLSAALLLAIQPRFVHLL